MYIGRVSRALAVILIVVGCSGNQAPLRDLDGGPLADDAGGNEGGDDGAPDAGGAEGDLGTIPPQSCGQVIDVNALYAERVGWGATTTGGDPGNVYVVNTLSGGASGTGAQGSLRRALESTQNYWIVFAVDGKINLGSERVNVRSNKTIDGRGKAVTINGELRMSSVQNILVTDVTLSNDPYINDCGQLGDVVIITGPGGASPSDFASRRFWFHHVRFERGGDGLLDLRGATDVTISWSHFREHSKGLLMWRDSNQQPAAGMRVTMHHNFIDQLTVRGPRFHYGKIHYFNNFVYRWYDHGTSCLDGGQCLYQGNVFESRDACTLAQIYSNQCSDPAPCGDDDGGTPAAAVVTDDSDNPGFTRDDANLLLNGAQMAMNGASNVFTNPGYTYPLEVATPAMSVRVRENVGPRTTMCD